MSLNRILVLATALTGALPAAAAAGHDYVIERPHTQISFFASHEGFSWSQGEFDQFGGTFHFDEQDWSKNHVQVEIETASLRFDDAVWDGHMRSDKFFNVAAFPKATFRSTRMTKTGANTGTLVGDLTLLGVTRPVTLDVTYNRSAIHSVSKLPIVGFSARGKLDRTDWGMATAAPLVASLPPEVELRIEVEGIRADAVPAKAD